MRRSTTFLTDEPSAVAGGSSAFPTVSAEGSGLGAPQPVPLIGLAHGSRHADTAPIIAGLMAAVAELFDGVAVPAFLDLTAPDLDSVVADLAAQGHRRVVVVPLLFTAAFHARVDAPAAIATAAKKHGVELITADILGTGDDVAAVLRQSAERAGIGDDASVLLYAVGSSRPEANDAVADLASRLAAGRSGSVTAVFGAVEPRVDSVLEGLSEPIAALPLFLAPGLLLDPLLLRAAASGWAAATPLGALAAPIVLARYRAALNR